MEPAVLLASIVRVISSSSDIQRSSVISPVDGLTDKPFGITPLVTLQFVGSPPVCVGVAPVTASIFVNVRQPGYVIDDGASS